MNNKGYSIIALIFGIISILLSFSVVISLISGIIAIIFGILGIKTTRKNMGIAGLLTGIFGIICTILFVCLYLFLIYKNFDIFDYDYDYDYSYFDEPEETLNIEDLYLNYYSDWSKDNLNSDENKKVLKKDDMTIEITYSTSNIYMTTEQFADSLIKAYKNHYTILSDKSEVEINQNTWIKIKYMEEFLGEKTISSQLFLADDYNYYSFTFTAEEEDYYDEIFRVKKIYNTLKLDNTKDELSSKDAKLKLVGEWDLGKKGYLVIEDKDNKFYLYKDSSKSMDNVYFGTYNCDNKIKTYAAGYADGLYLELTIDEVYMDGKKTEAKNNRVDYAFTPSNNGTYQVKDMVTYDIFTAKKVK